ncbi:MAG: imidazoleglycerol-phosphate dehydratase HisB, partial [Candidatus Amulumruptor sp.]|nr:imidazoleglycerol-phosphate dehydratase HisB [Candidatus Amulumruptor sp.]
GIMVGEASEWPQGGVMASSDWMKIARHILSTGRDAHIVRNTSETKIDLYLNLDGGAPSRIDTGLKFYDHMLNQIPHHGGVTLNIICRGDLDVDEHHTMEDVAIALGEAISQALGSKRGIERYGFVLPMDESRAMVLIDFGGRSELVWDVNFTREYVGDTPTEMYEHLFKSLASAMHANLYVAARGKNNHHIIEGVFKAFARALRQAVSRNPFSYDLPSSKGVL